MTQFQLCDCPEPWNIKLNHCVKLTYSSQRKVVQGEEKRTLVSPMEPALQAEQLARASRFYISLLGVSIIYRTPLSHWPYIVLVTYHCVLH